jgi:sugar lactone lactonase YvrE
MSETVELVLDAKAELGEGAIWHGSKRLLYWVDIDPGLVHVYDPATGHDRAVSVGQPVGTVVPRASGGVAVALRDGFAALDLDGGKLTMIADPEKELKGNRFNDGKCDPAGRFWAGTLGKDGGSLYRLDRDLTVSRIFGGVRTSNGIVWSLDRRTMYFIDTPTREVAAFDYDDATGAVSNRRVAVKVPKENGHPDGSTLDAEGNLWVAHWDGWNVTCYDPRTGRQLRQIRLPVARVTSCAFAEPGMDVLYITCARTGIPEAELKKQPLAGGLFKVKPGVRGIPAPEFLG